MANVNGTEINLMPTEGMREEARRYRAWKADGEAGGCQAVGHVTGVDGAVELARFAGCSPCQPDPLW